MAENNEKKGGERNESGLGGMLDSLKNLVNRDDDEKKEEERKRQAQGGGIIGNIADQLTAQAREAREELTEEQRKKDVAEARELRQAREEQRREEQRPSAGTASAGRREDKDDQPRQGLGGALGNIAGSAGAMASNATSTRGTEGAPAQADAGQRYTVQPGDTLSKIAQRFYGNLDAWRGIYDANRGIIGDNPDVIHAGQSLHIPPAPAQAAAPSGRTYTVQSGDTLRAIAQRHYGDEMQWPKIYEANRDQISNPDLIHVGQVLRIP